MTSRNFSDLNLPKEMLHNLEELGFKEMTPIQALSLPVILEKKDIIAKAKTGSGKTAAFGLGLLARLDVKKFKIQSLVLCPTRELADQVAKELRRLARATHNIKILSLCGGNAFGPQLGSLRHGAHIIVGTPGRVLAHLTKGSLSLTDLEVLVLDEADRMLDMGFIEEIQNLIAHAPSSRQTLLFSATYPDSIEELSSSIQNDAVQVEAESQESANNIEEIFYESEDKAATLVKILAKVKPETAIVFCNMKIQTQDMAKDLRKMGIDALAIHGDLEQYQRNDVLVQFSNRSCSVLVATDVAARGIDIKELDMVVNIDLAKDESTYTHRIGRTGRAGASGLAFTIYSADEARDADFYKNETRLFKDENDLALAHKFSLTPKNVTLVIEGGKKDKVRPGDILGALTGDTGIAGKYVGKIDIYDRQAYVAIERTMIKQAHQCLTKGNLKGRKFDVWILD
ncbi:ATP-dependent RNA helicase DbpA [Sulfurimonas sp. MAG313]|nr:ATP-dependent RNA helicase DbpA [Sulfurimonas sp. MAG313]MDF1880204.1 ATP-dependent RNA helicase DbpA [Sulfurimonas sp. MAG313]